MLLGIDVSRLFSFLHFITLVMYVGMGIELQSRNLIFTYLIYLLLWFVFGVNEYRALMFGVVGGLVLVAVSMG